MEFQTKLNSSDVAAILFFRAVRDEDSFTILWELAEHSPTPVPFESIRKTFGTSPQYLTEILNRLNHLGVATKAGRQWTVTNWAKSNLETLEEFMKDIQVEVAEPVSFDTGMYASDASQVATQNGFWVGSTSQVTAGDSFGTGSSRTGSTSVPELKSPTLAEKPQNEARNHDYKR